MQRRVARGLALAESSKPKSRSVVKVDAGLRSAKVGQSNMIGVPTAGQFDKSKQGEDRDSGGRLRRRKPTWEKGSVTGPVEDGTGGGRDR